jgi:hypothetical protein
MYGVLSLTSLHGSRGFLSDACLDLQLTSNQAIIMTVSSDLVFSRQYISFISCNALYLIHPSLNMQKQQFTGIN